MSIRSLTHTSSNGCAEFKSATTSQPIGPMHGTHRIASTPMPAATAAASNAVGTTVTLSSEGLKALELAGKAAVDVVEAGGKQIGSAGAAFVHGVEDVAVGAWHAVEHVAGEATHLAEEGWDEVVAGAKEAKKVGAAAVAAVETGAEKLVSATTDIASSAASSAVFVAGAGGKTLRAALSAVIGPSL